ncbi:MAG: oligosaccharide flippase family protein [Candidatus Sumerlaeia bacterium]|nr:oligosaccharide flippase family protein [Candidatus Sumerlaeia bacterium]
MNRFSLLRDQLRYVTSKGFALGLSAAVTNLIGFLVLFAYNYYGTLHGTVGDYGIYSYVMAVMATLGLTSLTGLNWATLVASAQHKPHILRTAARRRIASSTLLGIPALLLTYLVIALWFPNLISAGRACLFLLPFFPFMYSFTGVYYYLNGQGKFWQFAWAQIVAALLNLAAVVICLRCWPEWSLLPPVATLASKTLFEAGLYWALIRRDRIPLLDQDRHLLSFGVKTSLTGVTGNLESHIDRLIVGTVFGFQDLGMYNAGRGIGLPLRQIPLIYYQLYTPKLARKTPGEAWRLTNRALAWGIVFLAPVFALIYWLLPWLYAAFLHKFDQSSFYARWFVAVAAAGIPFYFYCPFFHAQRQARREVTVRLTRTILITFGLLALMPHYGIMGAVYAQLFATAFMSFHSWWEARKSRVRLDSTASPPPSPVGENGQVV